MIQGEPTGGVGPRYAIYGEEFANDPHRAYAEMRDRHGALVPIELSPGVPATLVIGYAAALRILNDPERFPADPRNWQNSIPADSPVRPMMEWNPTVLRSSGELHQRFRRAHVYALDGIDLYELRQDVERIAVPLINSFCESGKADLVTQYAFPLVFQVLNRMVGCTPELGQRVAAGVAALFEGIDAEWGMKHLAEALLELIIQKRAHPGDDVSSRLVHHPSNLDDEEALYNLSTIYGAGVEPQQNLIVNTLLLMMTDERFGGSMLGGSLATRDALDEVLFNDPPLANFCTTYPRQAVLVEDTWLPANQPVLISLAACNNDPAIRSGDFTGNRSHLAWSIGPHACPARSPAYVVVEAAIDLLLDALPELELAIPAEELVWRPGPFHRALAALPVVFPPSPPLNAL
ncbi:cytochrome P450 [Nocardia implantans]|uniref:Cytochrome P450 n=1 Tax=Nocardia implantans TaxID=3108168 RepID=A0ABU6AS36_9NOCA|nr:MULTISPECIES: cytochrome P450 [unclassified Nocardia]MBF6191665.1 cytochrome P450 [Nocardia beijingensis]MEA3528028.1 cytochrome P450 [Nocardia sp. CDC192]MEB3510220.1 cytochrome P450 [Nocardia sp. CDC186]